MRAAPPRAQPSTARTVPPARDSPGGRWPNYQRCVERVPVADCPRCGAKHMTFDVEAQVHVSVQYDWLHRFEVFSVCRRCNRPTVFLIALDEVRLKDDIVKPGAVVRYSSALNQVFKVERFISLRDF